MKSLKLLLAWVWVAIPLCWGVWHSVRKSMPLFQYAASPAPAAAVAPSK